MFAFGAEKLGVLFGGVGLGRDGGGEGGLNVLGWVVDCITLAFSATRHARGTDRNWNSICQDRLGSIAYPGRWEYR